LVGELTCLPALACLLACGQPLPVFALESSRFAGVGQGGPVDIGFLLLLLLQRRLALYR
jgi:hypothetical protein